MKLAIVSLCVCFAIACSTTASQQVSNANTTAANTPAERPQTAIAHGPQEKTPPPQSGEKSKWTQSGDPIDTTEFDTAIMAAEKTLAAKTSDGDAKKALGAAYFKRAVALTDARQYASALGDYRRTVKYDASNVEAKEWIDRIISIYTSINRAYPAEGEEPPPLPFKKKANE